MPTALERLVWGYGDGSTLQAVDMPYGKLGAVICWKNYRPALRIAMYQQRVALDCAPTAADRDSGISTMRHVAMEGCCFVLSSRQHPPTPSLTVAGAGPRLGIPLSHPR